MSEDVAGGRYAAATSNLRAAVRWAIAALAATAGLLLAGLQLSQVGRLAARGPLRFGMGCAFAAVGVGTIVFMISSAVQVLTDDWITLTDFGRETVQTELQPLNSMKGRKRDKLLHELEEQVNNVAPELFGHVAPDLSGLHQQLRLANEKAVEASVTAGDLSAANTAKQVQAAAAAAVDCANYHRTVRLVRRLRLRLGIGIALLAVAAVGFAVVTQAPVKRDNLHGQLVRLAQSVYAYCAPLGSTSRV